MKSAPLGREIRKMLDSIERTFPDSGHKIYEIWPEAVGPDLARRASPISLKGGKLIVAVEGAAWLQELNLQQKLLIESLNSRLGPKTIKSVKFVAREFQPAEKESEAPFDDGFSKRELTDAEKKEIEYSVEEAGDPEIRSAMRNLMAASLRRASLKGNLK